MNKRLLTFIALILLVFLVTTISSCRSKTEEPTKPETKKPLEQVSEHKIELPKLMEALDKHFAEVPEFREKLPEVKKVLDKHFAEVGVEVNLTFNLRSGVSQQSYQLWTNTAFRKIQNAQGCVNSLSFGNMLDSPRVKWTSWWTALHDWAIFTESNEWQAILSELHYKATDINIEIWKLDKPMIILRTQTEEPVKPDTT
jgi:Na+-transporting methylmalonyl-CoA/oxaloacetate decarboxylase gamma subunit